MRATGLSVLLLSAPYQITLLLLLLSLSLSLLLLMLFSKWFEPRSISSSCSVIVWVSVVLKRTVGDSD